VFDGILAHVAGVGRIFHNTPFAQPFRTRTWHEDHDFPEIAFPFSAAATAMDDSITGAPGGLLKGDGGFLGRVPAHSRPDSSARRQRRYPSARLDRSQADAPVVWPPGVPGWAGRE
jgi:hypothetical protein